MAEPWNDCAMYVLEELKSLNDKYEGIETELRELNDSITKVKIKVAGMSAAIALIISLGMQIFKGLK